MKEIWKDIDGFEGYYQVSDLGRVRGLGRVVPNRSGCTMTLKERVLSITNGPKGYKQVTLNRDGRRYTGKVHRLVCTAFIPNPFGKPSVNHLDGDRANNCVDNLEWCTNLENSRHASLTGLLQKGENKPFSKLTGEKVLEIREKYSTGDYLQEDLAGMYGVDGSQISRVVNMKAWGHV